MKKRHLYISILSFCLASLAFAGCAKGEDEYIKLSKGSADFYGAENEPMVVTLTASSTVTANPNESWIKVSEITPTSFTVKVDDNESGYHRNGMIILQAGKSTQEFYVSQSVKDTELRRFRKLSNLVKASVSPGGKYAGGYYSTIAVDDSFIHHPVIIDLSNDETIEFGPYSEKILGLTDVYAITDTGVLFIADGEKGGCYAFDISTQTYTIPEPPAGFTFLPHVSHTSAGDGSVWVGYDTDKAIGDGGRMHPLKWENGVAKKLTQPTIRFTGDPVWYGAMARGCSADGSVIYGSTWDNSDFGLIYWVNDELKGYAGGKDADTGEDIHVTFTVKLKHEGILQDYNAANGLICQAHPYLISPNGKYIAATYSTKTVNEQQTALVEVCQAAFFNTETNTTKIIHDFPDSIGANATDDGIGFVGVGSYGTSAGYVVDIETGNILGKTEEWVKENYGITVPGGWIQYMSVDKEIVWGCMPEASAGGARWINWYVGPSIK